MTDEEMAEEYAEGLCKTCTLYTCRHNILQTCAIKESIKQAFLAGLKAGRPEWHKVADGDLPTVRRRFLVSNRYCTMIGYWNSGTFERVDEDTAEIASPIAWCEIPKYEEEMKQVGKIYSAVDADELEAGDIVISANNLISLKKYELKGLSEPLRMIRGKEFANRFETFFGVGWYNFAKLVCPKKHAKVYKAFQNGAKVERYCYDDDYEDGEWCLDNKPFWYEDFEYRIAELPKGLHWENSLIDDEEDRNKNASCCRF